MKTTRLSWSWLGLICTNHGGYSPLASPGTTIPKLSRFAFPQTSPFTRNATGSLKNNSHSALETRRGNPKRKGSSPFPTIFERQTAASFRECMTCMTFSVFFQCEVSYEICFPSLHTCLFFWMRPGNTWMRLVEALPKLLGSPCWLEGDESSN